jgi:hypothetical protein
VPVTLSQFLKNLFEDGRVLVSPPQPMLADELREAERTLVDLEAAYRLDLPGEAPPLSIPAASWAAVSMFHACQFVAYRDANEAMFAAAFGNPVPDGAGGLSCRAASQHYSVDLTFRFLPDLMRLARSDAESDPLLNYFRQWANTWPLSSVGMPDVAPASIEPIVEHPCLLGIYRDRILARNDASRRGDPRVEDAVLRALGMTGCVD